MKPLKVFWNGRRLKDIYPYATKFQVFKYRVGRMIRTVLKSMLVVVLVFVGLLIGSQYMPREVYVSQPVIVEVESKSPVLDRIAKCESGGQQFTNGQITLNGNTNGSVDIGKYQINNAVWGKKATAMGLNLAIEKDNEAFALYLYKNFGTEPWKYSKGCWNK
jgi:hypothetical protein